MIKTLAPTRIYACLANALYYILPIYQIVHLEAIFVKKEIMVMRAPFAAFFNAQEDE